nr:hypothetical protein Itr_chr02CG14480 [Ipomoea trifida]
MSKVATCSVRCSIPGMWGGGEIRRCWFGREKSREKWRHCRTHVAASHHRKRRPLLPVLASLPLLVAKLCSAFIGDEDHRRACKREQDATLGWQQSAVVSRLRLSPANLGRWSSPIDIRASAVEQRQALFPASCSSEGGDTLFSDRPASVTAPSSPVFR